MIPFFINLTASLRSEIKGYFQSETDVCLELCVPQEANAPDPGGLCALDVESSFVLKCHSSSTGLLHWLWMQETATDSMHPVEWKKHRNTVYSGIRIDRTAGKQPEGKMSRTQTTRNVWKLYHGRPLLFPACVDHVKKLESLSWILTLPC